jgi:hypothetical protein
MILFGAKDQYIVDDALSDAEARCLERARRIGAIAIRASIVGKSQEEKLA